MPSLDAIVRQLLQPLPGPTPTGRWMRYERAFMELPRLREEDNPTLPMGEWERPMVKADWRKVAEACVQLLQDDTKDFQLAGWLCDAWIRTAQMNGLCAGLALTAGLAENYWDAAWPAIEDGENERRVAPFVWMNENLPLTLRLHVALLPPTLHRAEAVTLLDWERAPTADDAKSGDGQPLSRREIRNSVKPADGDGLRELSERTSAGLTMLKVLSDWLDDKLGQDSPSLNKIVAALETLRFAADSLLQELPAPLPPTVETTEAGTTVDTSSPASPPSSPAADAAKSATSPKGNTETTSSVTSAPSTTINNRTEAYAALNALADYLQQIEPHSPAPYLVRRAAQLGQMDLPHMVREVTASAGSLDKFFELLGITPPH
jgi:type VI secretion system protein ImpA